MNEKIRPRTHSSFQTDDALKVRADAEKELPAMARAPDPGRDLSPLITGAVEDVGLGGTLPNTIDPMDPDSPEAELLERMGQKFTPTEAARARAGHNDPNRLGKPPRMNQAERLLSDYQKAEAAYKADYQGTRSERLMVPYLEARARCQEAGLLPAD